MNIFKGVFYMPCKKSLNSAMSLEKKLAELQQQLVTLREKEKSLQSEIITYFSSFLTSVGAFSIPKNILIGGLLHIIKSYEEEALEVDEWKKAGRTFSHLKKHIKHLDLLFKEWRQNTVMVNRKASEITKTTDKIAKR